MLDSLTTRIQLPYQIAVSLQQIENAQKLFELVNFAFGFIGLYDMVKNCCFESRDISKSDENFPRFQQTAFQIANLLGNISLILTASKSAPAVSVWKWSATRLFSHEQFNLLFGRGGAISAEILNRSVFITSFLLSLPSTLVTLYCVYKWLVTRPLKFNRKLKANHSYKSFIKTKDVYITVKVVSGTAQAFWNGATTQK